LFGTNGMEFRFASVMWEDKRNSRVIKKSDEKGCRWGWGIDWVRKGGGRHWACFAFTRIMKMNIGCMVLFFQMEKLHFTYFPFLKI